MFRWGRVYRAKKTNYIRLKVEDLYMRWIIISLVGWALALYSFSKLQQMKKHVLPTKSNTLLRDILKLSLNKYDDMTIAAMGIISSLKNHYTIDYCTLFTADNNNSLKLLASNVDHSFYENLESEVNRALKNMDHYKASITTSEDFLSYDSSRKRNVKYSYFIPLNIDNKLIGAIFIENKNVKDLNVEKEFFSIILENITIVLQNLLYFETINKLAMTDGLTGIYNRNYMNLFLANALQKKKKFTLAIFDIDHFKKFNDTYGHLFGDLTLKIVSSFVKSQLHDSDTIFRFGGEEFILYLENKTENQAFSQIESIRSGIEQLSIEDEKSTANVMCSFGCHEVCCNDTSITKIIEKADIALYHSKENGRNRTTKFSDVSL